MKQIEDDGVLVDETTDAYLYRFDVDGKYLYVLYNSYTEKVFYCKLLNTELQSDEFYKLFKNGDFTSKQTYYHGNSVK